MSNNIDELLRTSASNWERWGSDDELGTLNLQRPETILRGIESVKSGTVFTLGLPVGATGGDPVWPARSPPEHYMTRDKGHFDDKKVDREPFGGWENSDDVIHTHAHGTTHIDALGHAWYADELYNGHSAETTKGGLDRCGIDKIAEVGIVGRGILVDIARHRKVSHVGAGERIPLKEIVEVLASTNLTIEPGDILLLRTGAMGLCLNEGKAAFDHEYATIEHGDPVLNEPGISYSQQLVDWFADHDVSLFATDTITAEQTLSETTGTRNPLHPIFLRNLGMPIGEMHNLDALADACETDDRWDFLYTCGPMHIVGGSGAPANPIAVR